MNTVYYSMIALSVYYTMIALSVYYSMIALYVYVLIKYMLSSLSLSSWISKSCGTKIVDLFMTNNLYEGYKGSCWHLVSIYVGPKCNVPLDISHQRWIFMILYIALALAWCTMGLYILNSWLDNLYRVVEMLQLLMDC